MTEPLKPLSGITVASDPPSPRLALRDIVVSDILPTEFRIGQQRSPAAIPPELAALFGHERPAIQGEHKKGVGIIYEQAVSAFLSAFIDPEIPHAPQNHTLLLEDLRALWLQDGFLPPDELKLRLMRRYCPDLPDTAFETLGELLASRYNNLEPLTGFQRKEHAAVTTGLAHLYAVLTDKPVSMVEFDFLNMGGTNEFRRKLIAAARGVPVTDVDEKEAWVFTDQSARIISGIAREAMQVGAKALGIPDAQIHGFRTGGDEMRLVCVGISQIQSEQIIRDYVQPAIEKFTAEAGLHDHEHAKSRDDDFRRGFGAVCATIALDRYTRPGFELEQVDRRIAENKLMLGVRRQGKLPGTALTDLTPKENLAQYEDGMPPELRELLELSRSAGLLDPDEDEFDEDADEDDGRSKSKAESSLKFATLDPGAEDESTLDPTKAGKGGGGGGAKRRQRKKQEKKLKKQSRKELESRLKALGIARDLSKASDDDIRDVVENTVAFKLQSDIKRHAAHYEGLKQKCGTLYTPERSALGRDADFRSKQGFAMTSEQASKLLNASANVLQFRYGRFLTALPEAMRPFPGMSIPPTLFRTPTETDTRLMHAALEKGGVNLNGAQRRLFENVLASSSPVDSATRTYVGDVMPAIYGQFAKDTSRLQQHLEKNPNLLASMGHLNPADLKARAMAVSLENLAGINKLLGHDNANIVLNHFAHNIVLKSFETAGIGRENVEIGHDGGGRMLLAIRPIVGNAAGGTRALTDHDMKVVQSEINRQMQEFKSQNVFTFLESAQGTIPKGLDPQMKMNDIPDGKGRPELKGVDATSTVTTLNYRTDAGLVIRGGEHKDILVKQVESAITEKRGIALQTYINRELQGRLADGQGARQADQTVQRDAILGDGQNNPSGGDGGYRAESGQRRSAGTIQRPS